MYHFHEQVYDEDPETPLGSVSSIVHAIGIGWISLYGIKKQEDGKYTIAFANENTDACYKKEGFSESEMLEIFNTEYKGISYEDMKED
jgi:hypothetical protein